MIFPGNDFLFCFDFAFPEVQHSSTPIDSRYSLGGVVKKQVLFACFARRLGRLKTLEHMSMKYMYFPA